MSGPGFNPPFKSKTLKHVSLNIGLEKPKALTMWFSKAVMKRRARIIIELVKPHVEVDWTKLGLVLQILS